MLISVLVTTYNRPDALRLVLDALVAQTDDAFEVVIADDGSIAATAELIAGYQGCAVPVTHTWQEDLGFRAGAARNRAIAAARGKYLVFLDGDCIPAPDFVARHRQLAEAGHFVSGSRVLLAAVTTAAVTAAGRLDWRPLRWLGWRWRGQLNKWLPLWLRLPDGPLRHYRKLSLRRIKTCNFAAWADDVWHINGFDESFVGWGHEDADFALRLFHAGLRRKSGAWATEVLHLWHREAPRDEARHNAELVALRRQTRPVRAEQGLNQYQRLR